MSLTSKQKQLILYIDNTIASALVTADNSYTLLSATSALMPDIKEIIQTASDKELEMYVYGYKGFYRYMKLLQKLTQGMNKEVKDLVYAKVS